jgi:hypothetical protein
MTAIALTLASPPVAFALLLVLQRLEARLLPVTRSTADSSDRVAPGAERAAE